jgi:hypothetical protein
MRVVLKEIKMYWHYLLIILICIIVDRNTILKGNNSYYMQIPPVAIYIVCSIISYFIFAIQIYRKETINRLVLGLSLFASLGSIAYLNNISSVLYYYDNYGYLLPLAFIMGVGLFAALFTQGNFIGIFSDNKKAIRIASLKLFGASCLATLLSFYTQTITFSLLFLAVYDWKLRYVLAGKSNGTWKFKW